MGMPCNLIFCKEPANELGGIFAALTGCFVTALSGKFEEMQYNDVEFDETPDVSELEALKRSAGVHAALSLALLAVPLAIL